MRFATSAGTATRRCRAASSKADKVECPLHYAVFDVRNGRLLEGPISANIPTYDTHVEGDTVFVRPS